MKDLLECYAPDGTRFTRTTERQYQFVVLVKSPLNSKWLVRGWCGRRDLAEKLAARTTLEVAIVEPRRAVRGPYRPVQF